MRNYFLKYDKNVKSIAVEPLAQSQFAKLAPTPGGWKSYELQGKAWGRSRLTVTYEDGLTQTIHYFVTKPASEVVADMGRFLTTKQWFVDPERSLPSQPVGDDIRSRSQPACVCRTAASGSRAWAMKAAPAPGSPRS